MSAPVTAVLTAEWTAEPYAPVLLGVLVLAGIGTTMLFLVGLAAYRRRRTRTYLLITVALGLLVVRTIVGFGTVYDLVPMFAHHLIEHTFDFFIALLLLLAIYVQGADLAD